MRPTEWGFKEWGFEGEYGHRVLILDDMTKQRQTNEKNTACASGDRDEVVRR